MKFELDEILIDDIIFHMEDQDGIYLLDTLEGQVITDIELMDMDEDDSESERFIDLPEWGSNDGFRLMEKFTAGLKNPIVRQELTDALNRNKGVFRAFKNILEHYPEIGKHWFKFKEQEMKKEVILWYNALREEWGLKPFGSEPDDNSFLVLEDFVIKEKTDDSLHCDYCYIAENAAGEFTGKIAAVKKENMEIILLEVKPEYRGLGIAKMLLAKMLEKADELKLNVIIDLPDDIEFFARALHIEGFQPSMQRFIRKCPFTK